MDPYPVNDDLIDELLFDKRAFQLPFVFEKLFQDVSNAIHIAGLSNMIVSYYF